MRHLVYQTLACDLQRHFPSVFKKPQDSRYDYLYFTGEDIVPKERKKLPMMTQPASGHSMRYTWCSLLPKLALLFPRDTCVHLSVLTESQGYTLLVR